MIASDNTPNPGGNDLDPPHKPYPIHLRRVDSYKVITKIKVLALIAMLKY